MSLLDIFPTLTALLGLERDPRIQGEDLSDYLLGHGEPRAEVPAELSYGPNVLYALLSGHYKAIRRMRDAPGVALYDLESDPGEHDDIAASHKNIVQALVGEMGRRREQDRALRRTYLRHQRDVRTPLSQEVRDQLDGLGYLGHH
jgi:arylsulfatase A-like enzyme